ncbi:MAG: glycosyltransferase family 4 protein [Acidimicrobiales bacterium]
MLAERTGGNLPPPVERTRPRVAHVVCTEDFAGVERYVSTLSVALAGHTWDVVVLGGREESMRPTLEEAGVRWVPAPTVATAVRRLREQFPVDLVHAHMTQAEVASVLAAVRTRTPVVCTRHFASDRGSSTIRRTVSHLFARRISEQVSISQFVAERIDGPSTVIVPGVPNCGTIVDSSQRHRQVLMAQRLEEEKRADLGVSAWAASGLAEAGWSLLIAGDGSQRGSLLRLAERLGVADSCDFLGFRSDVADLIRQAGIFLAPRPDEPLGLSVIEAMAAGTPVVAADGGGHRESLGLHPTAALYPPEDTTAAGLLLRRLALDPLERDNYGAELAEIQKALLSIEVQAGRTVDLYRELLRRTQ